MVELTDEQKAFLVGLLEAEGALLITHATIAIKLKMTEYFEIFKWLSTLFNKKIYIEHYGQRKSAFRIMLYGYDAYNFLLETKNYFIIKEDNVDLLIKAYETKDFAFYREALIPYTLKRGLVNPMRSFNINIGGDLIGSYLYGLYIGDGCISFYKNSFNGGFVNKYYNACKLFYEYCKFGTVTYLKNSDVWRWMWGGNGCYRKLLELGISKDLPSWLKKKNY